MLFAETSAETGRCFAVSDMDEIRKDTLIPLGEDNLDVLGKVWTGSEWIEDTAPEPVIPLSESEQAILDTAINTEYLVCLADLGV